MYDNILTKKGENRSSFMDYVGFVRTYYRMAMNKLNKFTHYSGGKSLLEEELDIPNEFLHNVEANLDALPNFEVNINAPQQYFERFLDYYGRINIDLSGLLLDKSGLVELYSDIMEADSEEVVEEAISLYVNIAGDSLAKMGILE